MAKPILQTKLYAPPSRPDLIDRPRLISQLNQGLHHKLTLISAPAGFGKSTLAGEWVSTCGIPTAWLSLDEADGELTRFLTYFVAALQTMAPGFGDQVMALTQSAQPPAADALLTLLLNELSTIQEKFVLVLDDYHVLESAAIDDALTFLLDYMPPQMHLAITTREDPSLPLASYRARGQMTELRAANLRFTTIEATEFLNQVVGLTLSQEEVAALESRTEGWIAGLQMAALSMQGRKDIAGFIKAFTGSHRFVLDYLAEEVLQRQSDDMRSFLLNTAILERLSGPLCNAVTEREDSQEMLLALERGNLFVIPLDDERSWYRYHHLFADVLQARALDEQPERLPLLHLRASGWYAEQEQHTDAIRHAFASAAFERAAFEHAADLVELAWPALPKGIPPATWLGWVNALPADLTRARPVLSAGAAWMLIDSGELEAAEGYLREAEQWLGTDGKPLSDSSAEMIVVNQDEYKSLPQSMAVARAYLALAYGDFTVAIQNAQRALELLQAQDYYWHGGATLFLGMANLGQGNLEVAYESTAESIVSMRAAGSISFEVMGTTLMADIRMIQGRLDEAEQLYADALALAGADVDDNNSSVASGVSLQSEHAIAGQNAFLLQTTADLFVGLSELHRIRGDLDIASQQVTQGKALGTQQILGGSEARLCVSMARINGSQGDWIGALNQLQIAETLHKRDAMAELRPASAAKVRIWIKQNRLGDALGWMLESGFVADDELSFKKEFEHVTLARVLIADYRNEGNEHALHDATKLLARLLDATQEGGRTTSAIEILVLQALLHQAEGNKPAALAPLKQALTLAEPQGYVQVFVDEGEPMRLLLAESLTSGIHSNFITQLLTAMDSPADNEDARPDVNQLLIEPLSTRELEVLGLLASGHTNQAVADDLVIAVSTVKKHVNNIFGKLGVANRTQAINRARELDIL